MDIRSLETCNIPDSPEPETFANTILLRADEIGVDFIYLSRDAHINLGAGFDPLYSRYEEWNRVVDLTDSLFGSGLAVFSKELPEWLQAGILFADICIEQCKRQAQQPVLPNIFRDKNIIGATGPHEYLGYARACFNSGLCEKGSNATVSISKEDWLACQRCWHPPRNPDLELCQMLAERLKREGQALLI